MRSASGSSGTRSSVSHNFQPPLSFLPLTIVFLVIDIVTSTRIASVCIEDVVVRVNKIIKQINKYFDQLFAIEHTCRLPAATNEVVLTGS